MHHCFSLRALIIWLTLAMGLLLQACLDHNGGPNPPQQPGQLVYLLSSANQLIQVNRQSLETSLVSRPLTGLLPSDSLLAIDVRPATGQLYALSTQRRLYLINPAIGAARALANLTPPLLGRPSDIDFDPTTDLLRVVTAQGQQVNINPVTGEVASQGPVLGNAQGIAFSANRAGATATQLYAIDPLTDALYLPISPSSGTLRQVGLLGLDISAVGGFDLVPSGEGLAALATGSQTALYSVNLTTGQLQRLGQLPANVIGLAMPTEPVAYATDVNNTLLIFNPSQATATPVRIPISGPASDDRIAGIDFRPRNGQLYAITRAGRLYAVHVATGVATPLDIPGLPAYPNGIGGFDFDPVSDQLRLIVQDRSSYSVDLDARAVKKEPSFEGLPIPVGAAYTNNYVGATATTLYILNGSLRSSLFRADAPSSGYSRELGLIHVPFTPTSGFDIGGQSNKAYLLTLAVPDSYLYEVDLEIGATNRVSTVLGTDYIYSFTLGLGF